jgi:hypothetical protein
MHGPSDKRQEKKTSAQAYQRKKEEGMWTRNADWKLVEQKKIKAASLFYEAEANGILYTRAH